MGSIPTRASKFPAKESGGRDGSHSIQLGNYEINLNVHGGIGTDRIMSNFAMGKFHGGIQDVGKISIGGGGTADFTPEWGTQRASLIPLQGQSADYYIHGKGLYYSQGLAMTHGCIATPEQRVLGVLFKLDPSGVGEGAKNGRIAVSVQGVH